MVKFGILCVATLLPSLAESACLRDVRVCQDHNKDCVAGNPPTILGEEKCTCAQGYTARATGFTSSPGATVPRVITYECCNDTDRPNIGETCGWIGCSAAECTSPGQTPNTFDCSAGFPSEGCTCKDGKVARITGTTTQYLGFTAHQYLCCSPRDAAVKDAYDTGVTCGAFTGATAVRACGRLKLACSFFALLLTMA